MNDAKMGFPYLINGKPAQTDDGTPSSAKVLADAGFEPVDDFILIQRTPHGSGVISSDDVLDITGGKSEFFAFEGGDIFELTVNEHSIFWGAATITGRQVRHLANVPEHDQLILARDPEKPEVISDEENIDLKARGVEHLRTRKPPAEPSTYHYFVDGVEYTTDREQLTGAQITAKIQGWNPANSLVLESEGSAPDEVIHANTVVELKGRKHPAHFTIVPPATFGQV
jgi:hypothetical protein